MKLCVNWTAWVTMNYTRVWRCRKSGCGNIGSVGKASRLGKELNSQNFLRYWTYCHSLRSESILTIGIVFWVVFGAAFIFIKWFKCQYKKKKPLSSFFSFFYPESSLAYWWAIYSHKFMLSVAGTSRSSVGVMKSTGQQKRNEIRGAQLTGVSNLIPRLEITFFCIMYTL